MEKNNIEKFDFNGLEEKPKHGVDIEVGNSYKNYNDSLEGMKKIEDNVLSMEDKEKKLTGEEMEKLITKEQRLELEELAETGSVEEMLIGFNKILSPLMKIDPTDLADAQGNLTEKGRVIGDYCLDYQGDKDEFKPKEWLALILADMRYGESMVKKPGDLKNMLDEDGGEKYWEVYDRDNYRNLKSEALGLFDGRYKSEMKDWLKEENNLVLFLPSVNGMQDNQWEILDDYVAGLQRMKYKLISLGANKAELDEQIKNHIDNIGKIKSEEDLWEKWQKYDEMEVDENKNDIR